MEATQPGIPDWWSHDLASVQQVWASQVHSRFAADDVLSLETAARYAASSHGDQTRAGGEPYIVHPLRVALSAILEFDVSDVDLLRAALLHDVVEDSGPSHDGLPDKREEIAAQFGAPVAELVEAVTRTSKGSRSADSFSSHYIQRLIAGGPHCILLKLLDKLDNLRDSPSHPVLEKQRKWVRETYEVYLLLLPMLGDSALERRVESRLIAALDKHATTVYEPESAQRYHISQLAGIFDNKSTGFSQSVERLERQIYRLDERLDQFLLFNPTLTYWLVHDGVQVVKASMAASELASAVVARLLQPIIRQNFVLLSSLASLAPAFGESDKKDVWAAVGRQLMLLRRMLQRPDVPSWLKPIADEPGYLLCAVHSRLIMPAILAFPAWHDSEGLLTCQRRKPYRFVLTPDDAGVWHDRLCLNLQHRNALWRHARGIGSTERANVVLRSIAALGASTEEAQKLLAMRLLSEYVDVATSPRIESENVGRDMISLWARLSSGVMSVPEAATVVLDFDGLEEFRRLGEVHGAAASAENLVKILVEHVSGAVQLRQIWLAFSVEEIAKRASFFFAACRHVSTDTSFEELRSLGIEVSEHHASAQQVFTIRPGARLAFLDRLPEAVEDEPRIRERGYGATAVFDILIREQLQALRPPLWMPRVYRILDTIADFDPEHVQRVEVRFNPGSDAQPFITYLPLPDSTADGRTLSRQQQRKEILAIYIATTIFNHGIVLGARYASLNCGQVRDEFQPLALTAQELEQLVANAVSRQHFDKYAAYLQTFNFDPFVVRADNAADRSVEFGTADMEFGTFLGIDIGGSLIKACLFDGRRSRQAAPLETIPAVYKAADTFMPVEELFDRLINHLNAEFKGELRWESLDGIGISWPGAIRESRLAGTSATLAKLQFQGAEGPKLLGYHASAEEIRSADLIAYFLERLRHHSHPVSASAAVVLENDGNAEAYGNYCMLARAGVIKPGQKVIVKLGTSIAGGDVNESGAVSPHVTEFGKAILDFRDCHSARSKWPTGTAREFVSSLGVRNLSRTFQFGGEPLFGTLDGRNEETRFDTRIESVEVGELLDLWRLLDIDPIEVNPYLDELVKNENSGSGNCYTKLYGRTIDAIRSQSRFADELRNYVGRRGRGILRRQFAAQGAAAPAPEDYNMEDVWRLGLQRLGVLLDQSTMQCEPDQLPASIDAQRLARKILGSVALFSQLGSHVAHFVILLYNVYRARGMKQIILAGGVLKGLTGQLVHRQAQGFLAKWYDKVYGPGKKLSPDCIILAQIADEIVTDDGMIAPYGAAMVASRAHKAAAWSALNESIHFLVEGLKPGQSLSVNKISESLGRSRFQPADVRCCLHRLMSRGALLPDANDTEYFIRSLQ